MNPSDLNSRKGSRKRPMTLAWVRQKALKANKELPTRVKAAAHLSKSAQKSLPARGARKALMDAMQKPDLCHLSSHMTESKISCPIHTTLGYK